MNEQEDQPPEPLEDFSEDFEDFFKNLNRFAQTIEYPNDVRLCWNWKGDTNKRGYGRFWYKGKKYQAHRVILCLLTGLPHPVGMEVDHRCSNTGCVNPFHLRYLTRLDNARASRTVGNRLNRGVLNGQATLTEEHIKEIRLWSSGGIAQHILALKYGVSQSLISLIVHRKKWAYVGD